jgi:hypothetical protein
VALPVLQEMLLLVAVLQLDVLILHTAEVAELVDHVHLHRLIVVHQDGNLHVNKGE